MVERPYNGFPAEYRNKRGNLVYKLFKTGRLTRPTQCVMCGRTAGDNPLNIQAHTEDYHRQTAFVGLCPCCHFSVHSRFRNLATWYRWRDAVASGWQPPRTRDYRIWKTIWSDFRVQPLGEVDRSNWAFTLPDIEPDLYNRDVEVEDITRGDRLL